MKKILLTAAALGAVIAGNAFAEVREVTPNLDKGTKQATFYGSYDNNDALDYQLNIAGSYGYFFWDNIQIAGVLGWSSNDLSDMVEIGIVGTYNFDTGTPWVPFVKAGALYAGVEVDDDVYDNVDDIDDSTALFRLGGGVKYFFRDGVAMAAALNYDQATDDLYYDDNGEADDYNVTIQLGLEFYFD